MDKDKASGLKKKLARRLADETNEEYDVGAAAEFYIKLARQLSAEAYEYLTKANKEVQGSEAEARYMKYFKKTRLNADEAAQNAKRALARFQDDLYSVLF